MNQRFQKFTTLISGITRSISKIKCKEMERRGLKSTHLTCLFYTKALGENVTATDIASTSNEDKAAVSRAVTELEKMGYIEERLGGKKKYRAEIKLTQKGEDICEVINLKVDEYVDLASKNLTDEMRKNLYSSLESVMNNLNKLYNEVPNATN